MNNKYYLGLLSFVMVAVMSVCFSACSSDSDDDGTPSAPTVNGKRLVGWTSSEGDYTGTATLVYNSKGQIITYTDTFERINESYMYGETTITRSEPSKTYELSNGRIIKYGSLNFEYNSNGYLTKWDNTVLTWSNGNIVKINDKVVSYTKNSQSLLPILSIVDPYVAVEFDILYLQGYYGKRCSNLPASITYNNGFIITFDYTIENGVVTKMIEQNSNGLTIIYTFKWE
jgi:hypothetical protein